MRCYFMKDGRIASVVFLGASTDDARVTEAKKSFAANRSKYHADGFEVWDGARFVYRFPEDGSER
jgi:hypothetical protein